MTSAEAAALTDLVLHGDAEVPTIDPRRLAKAFVAVRTSRPGGAPVERAPPCPAKESVRDEEDGDSQRRFA